MVVRRRRRLKEKRAKKCAGLVRGVGRELRFVSWVGDAILGGQVYGAIQRLGLGAWDREAACCWYACYWVLGRADEDMLALNSDSLCCVLWL